MKELIGKTIKKVFIDPEYQHYITFSTDKGVINYAADGECCSESYFSEINRLSNLMGQEVVSVKEIDTFPEDLPNKESRQESDIIYGYSLETKKGESLIIFRNSSNGWYGGSCERCSVVPDDIPMVEIKSSYYEAERPDSWTDLEEIK